MLFRFPSWLPLTAIALLLGGCLHWGAETIDPIICDVGVRPMDLEPAVQANLQMPRTEEPQKTGTLSPELESLTLQPVDAREPLDTALAQEKPDDPQPKKKEGPPPLYMPSHFPGGADSYIKVAGPDDPPEKKAEAVRRLFPPLAPLGPDVEPEPGPNGNPLTLADFQRLAVTNSPLIKQALADVRAAEGAALQAGLYPNPNFGYVSESVNSGGTAGLQGAFFEQKIIGWGKLDLARAIATVDVRNAQLAVRATRNSVAKSVRNAYFAALVALEGVKVNGAVYEFADRLYQSQLDLSVRGLGAPYEPMQLRLLVVQARTSLATSRNAYLAAWKQLAAAVGLPGMKPTQLAGRVDMPLPIYRHDTVLARVLTQHTDVLTAQNAVLRAQTSLRLAQITPLPDPDVQLKLEKDYTVAPFLLTNSLQITVPVAIWDRNQGGILQAEGQLLRAEEEAHRVRADLTSRLADAFGRYETNRYQLEEFRTQVLPYQIKAYRGMYTRWHLDMGAPRVGVLSPTPTFQDLFNTQVLMATNIGNYLTTLATTWTAVMDVADLLQTEDLFQVAETQEVCPVPSLDQLPPLPCQHPCSPLRDPALRGADGQWPAAAPRKEDRTMPPTDSPKEEKKQTYSPVTPAENPAAPSERPATPVAQFSARQMGPTHLPPPRVDAQLLDEPPPMPKLPDPQAGS
jgi:cobalt-zinc-cadmium efflux system outer membrane protein